MAAEARSVPSDTKIDNPVEGPLFIHGTADREPIYESPININITKTVKIEVPPLEWHNMDLPPKKMKITNTGYTLILSAKWYQERPYLSGGPLLGNYVFSQLHFHWGRHDAEGSEHTIDDVRYPVEMHAVFFKANYLTQESALKEKDGIILIVYIFKSARNPAFQTLIDNIKPVQKPHSSKKFDPVALNVFLKTFKRDYFVYWGSVTTTVCLHYILWFITREPVGVASEQVNLVEELRSLLDTNEEPLQCNFREVRPLNDRQVFHACPSGSEYATLLHLP